MGGGGGVLSAQGAKKCYRGRRITCGCVRRIVGCVGKYCVMWCSIVLDSDGLSCVESCWLVLPFDFRSERFRDHMTNLCKRRSLNAPCVASEICLFGWATFAIAQPSPTYLLHHSIIIISERHLVRGPPFLYARDRPYPGAALGCGADADRVGVRGGSCRCVVMSVRGCVRAYVGVLKRVSV